MTEQDYGAYAERYLRLTEAIERREYCDPVAAILRERRARLAEDSALSECHCAECYRDASSA